MKNIALLLSCLLLGCASDAGLKKAEQVQFKPSGAKASSGQSYADHHPEYTPYDASADAAGDIAQALAAAKMENKNAILAFGANWCHDSRALAAHFDTPRFRTLIRDHYKLAYINVGKRDRNINLAQKFGVESIVGTPTVFITNSHGVVLNAETAPTWRDAASREDEAVWDYFQSYALMTEPKTTMPKN